VLTAAPDPSAPAAPRPPAGPELLAPAGDWECVRAAVENGADAVYFGLERFNARMRARNFTQADLPAVMEYLHARGVRGYVTFNTLVFTAELEDAAAMLRTLIATGVDAAIVQDIGVCRLIRALSPDFPIHCSTQMTITSPAGVAFARDLGAQLVVLARENSLTDIARIHAAQAEAGAASLPLEVFVHGALCVAYSGQCLTSESLGGRSANRGECAQACRLPYDLIADGAKVDLGDRRYLLSPQDLAGLEVLPELVRAGVASLKIEGRLKSPEYVASITRVYRQAIDRLRAGAEPPAVGYELQMAFSRGLYPGWFRGIDNQQLVHARFGTKRGVFLGEVTAAGPDWAEVRLAAAVKPGDGVVFDAGQPEAGEQGGRVYRVDPSATPGVTRLGFGRGDIDGRRVQPGQRLWKTNDPALDRELRATFAGDQVRHQRPLDLEVHGAPGGPLTVLARDEQGHIARADSAAPLTAAERQPLGEPVLRAQLGRLGGTPFTLGRLAVHLEGDVMLPVSELNRIRRELVTELDRQRRRPRAWTLRDPGPVLGERFRGAAAPVTSAPATLELIAVVRQPEQLAAAWAAGCRTLYCEFEDPKQYRASVAEFRALQAGAPEASIWLAAPRIFKPGEDWILRQVRSAAPDGFLVRNHDHLAAFAGERRRGDFSLNVANPWTAEHFIRAHGLERVTASYDLNLAQLEALLGAAPPEWFDLTLHQHMPMFHMEHCVFCAFLSTGKDYRDCGRPCDTRRVALRDRVGAELPVKADAGCRNTVYNNRAQTGAEYATRLRNLGARSFRIEFVWEEPAEVRRTLERYHALFRGEITGADLWRELRLINQLGVTRGQIEAPARALPRKGTFR